MVKDPVCTGNYKCQFIQILIRFSDIILILFAAELLFYAQNKVWLLNHYYFLIVFAVVFQQILFRQFQVYYNLFSNNLMSYFSSLFVAWSIVCTLLVLLLFFTKSGESVSRFWLGSWYFTCLFSFTFYHFAVRFWLYSKASQQINRQNIVLFGASDIALKAMNTVQENKFVEYNVDCVFDDDKTLIENNFSQATVKGSLADGLAFIQENSNSLLQISDEIHNCEIWITLSYKHNKFLNKLLAAAQDTTYTVKYVPNLAGLKLLNPRVSNYKDLNVFTLIDIPFKGVGLASKVFQDKVLALLFLIMASPIMLIISLLIKLDSPGPVIFKQKRYGIDGQEIEVWKFRSMYTCENTVALQARKNDSRVTPIGRFIRRTSLDELPQFFNVLLGQMSLVGPRPHAVNHNEEYRKKIPGYMLRHKIKPGITGWAQVNGWRGETDALNKMEKRVEHDLFYIRNWSTLFDLKIIFMTIKSIFSDKNAY